MFGGVFSPKPSKSQLCVAVNNLHAALAVEHPHRMRLVGQHPATRFLSCVSIFPHTPRVMRGILRICVIMMIASVNALRGRLLPSLRRGCAHVR